MGLLLCFRCSTFAVRPSHPDGPPALPNLVPANLQLRPTTWCQHTYNCAQSSNSSSSAGGDSGSSEAAKTPARCRVQRASTAHAAERYRPYGLASAARLLSCDSPIPCHTGRASGAVGTFRPTPFGPTQAFALVPSVLSHWSHRYCRSHRFFTLGAPVLTPSATFAASLWRSLACMAYQQLLCSGEPLTARHMRLAPHSAARGAVS